MALMESILAMMGLGQEAEALTPAQLAKLSSGRKKPAAAPVSQGPLGKKSAQQSAPPAPTSEQKLASEVDAAITAQQKPEYVRKSTNVLDTMMELVKKNPEMAYQLKTSGANVVGPDENLSAVINAKLAQEFMGMRDEDLESLQDQKSLTTDLKNRYERLKKTTAGVGDLTNLLNAVDTALGTQTAKGYKSPAAALREQFQEAIKNKMLGEKMTRDDLMELYKKQFLPPEVLSTGRTPPRPAGAAGGGIKGTDLMKGAKALAAYNAAQNTKFDTMNTLAGVKDWGRLDTALLASPNFLKMGVDALKGDPELQRIQAAVNKAISEYVYQMSGKTTTDREFARFQSIMGAVPAGDPLLMQSAIGKYLEDMVERARIEYEGGFTQGVKNQIRAGTGAISSEGKGAQKSTSTGSKGRDAFRKALGK